MRRRTNATLLLLAGAFALAARAEDARVSGPISGFIFHGSSHSIRLILGSPGSAYLGPAIAQGLDAASVSPLGKSALAMQSGRLNILQGLDTGQPAAIPIEGAIGAVDLFAWSQDGASAAVYSTDARQAQIIRNLDGPKPPAVESTLDLSSTDGPVTTLAFDGKRLLVGAGGLYTADQSGLKLLFRMANPAGIALAPGNRDLYVADRESNQVWMIRDYAGDTTPMPFADDRAGIAAPVGLRLSANGRSLLIANSGTRSVDALEISTRASLKHIDLDFEPGKIEALGSGPLALLNSGLDGEPLYLIDGGERLAVYFVPAGSEE